MFWFLCVFLPPSPSKGWWINQQDTLCSTGRPWLGEWWPQCCRNVLNIALVFWTFKACNLIYLDIDDGISKHVYHIYYHQIWIEQSRFNFGYINIICGVNNPFFNSAYIYILIYICILRSKSFLKKDTGFVDRTWCRWKFPIKMTDENCCRRNMFQN